MPVDEAAKQMIVAWANSGGFAAVHNAGATDEQIAEDFLRWITTQGWTLLNTGDLT